MERSSSLGVGLEERDKAWLCDSDTADVDKAARLEYKMRSRYLRHAKKSENLMKCLSVSQNSHGSRTNLATVRMAVSAPTVFMLNYLTVVLEEHSM